MAKTPAAAPAQAAKPKVNKTKTVASSAQSVGLFPAEVLYSLKLGSVKVPVIEEGKGTWREISQGNWDLKHQRLLIGYWQDQKKENPTFSIEAKMQKLFIMPATTETVSSAAEGSTDVEVQVLDDDDQTGDDKTGGAATE